MENKDNPDTNMINLYILVNKILITESKKKLNFYEKEYKQLDDRYKQISKENESKKRKERNTVEESDIKLKKLRVKELVSKSKEECLKYIEDIISCFNNFYASVESIINQNKESNQLYQILVFAKKILGDFFRYKIDYTKYRNEINDILTYSEKYYKEGLDLCKFLDYFDPYKLAIELNYGVLLYQYKNELTNALDLYRPILSNIKKDAKYSKYTLDILKEMEYNVILWEHNTNKNEFIYNEAEEESLEY